MQVLDRNDRLQPRRSRHYGVPQVRSTLEVPARTRMAGLPRLSVRTPMIQARMYMRRFDTGTGATIRCRRCNSTTILPPGGEWFLQILGTMTNRYMNVEGFSTIHDCNRRASQFYCHACDHVERAPSRWWDKRCSLCGMKMLQAFGWITTTE